MSIENIELKSCPFCGGEAKIEEDMGTRFFEARCECTKCHIQTRQHRVDTKKYDSKITDRLIEYCKNSIAEQWNSRV